MPTYGKHFDSPPVHLSPKFSGQFTAGKERAHRSTYTCNHPAPKPLSAGCRHILSRNHPGPWPGMVHPPVSIRWILWAPGSPRFLDPFQDV